MQEVTQYFSTHPLATSAAIVLCCLIVFFFLRKLVTTLIFIVAVFVLTMIGYSYYRDTTSLETVIQKTTVESQELFNQLKNALQTMVEKTMGYVNDVKDK